MNIYGFDKTSLLNYPEHVAATVFTGGCNMRCPYCHNSELVLNPPADMRIPEEEVFAHLRKRRNVLTGLCITGGEPTLQPDICDFIIKVRALGYKIKLDTNGLKPDVLKRLLCDGLLDYVAMDIKAGRDNYSRVSGMAGAENAESAQRSEMISAITESISLLVASGIEYEFRTTVVKGLHDRMDFADIKEWISEIIHDQCSYRIHRYFLQAYVDRETVMDRLRDFGSFSKEELEVYADILRPISEDVSVRGID